MNAIARHVARQFEAKPGVREACGVLVSIVGPSSSGKTYSAMRIATGIQRTVGGDIDVIDTENGRALYYADRFKFNHIRFGAPFSPLDYLDAVRFSARRGAKTVVIDSASHEHEGPGGVLEWHDEETDRLMKAWGVSEGKAQLAAWGEPKAARRKFINELLQFNINLVLTFRAKEKLKMVKGKDPVELGWQPICGEEFMYEMALQCLLKPGSRGVPTWRSNNEHEQAVIKCPEQFESLFRGEPKAIDEDLGKALADWAMGGAKAAPELDQLIADYAKCLSQDEFKAIDKRRFAVWAKPMPAGYKARIKEAADAAGVRISTGDAPPKDSGTSAAGSVGTAPDITTWIATLTGQPNSAELNRTWEQCMDAHNDKVPSEVYDAYEATRERLVEREATQQEF